jgi:hypothetical protein
MRGDMATSMLFLGWVFVVLNGFLYGTKFFLRSRGYNVSFYRHGSDFVNLQALARQGTNVTDVAIAKRWLLALRVSAILLVIAALFVIRAALAS